MVTTWDLQLILNEPRKTANMLHNTSHLTHPEKVPVRRNSGGLVKQTVQKYQTDKQGQACTCMGTHTPAHTHNTDLCGNTMAWQLVTAIVVTSTLSRPPALFSVCLCSMNMLQCLQQLSSVKATEGCCANTKECCSLVMADVSQQLRSHVTDTTN